MLAAVLVMAAAMLQPPADEPAPLDPVCLTNACSTPLRPTVKFKTVREAVAGGNAAAVRELGGTPGEAIQAMQQRLNDKMRASDLETQVQVSAVYAFISQFADGSNGANYAFVNDGSGDPTPSGATVTGAIRRTNRDGSSELVHLLSDGGGMIIRDRPPPGFE